MREPSSPLADLPHVGERNNPLIRELPQLPPLPRRHGALRQVRVRSLPRVLPSLCSPAPPHQAMDVDFREREKGRERGQTSAGAAGGHLRAGREGQRLVRANPSARVAPCVDLLILSEIGMGEAPR